jgi:hypothetical protein
MHAASWILLTALVTANPEKPAFAQAVGETSPYAQVGGEMSPGQTVLLQPVAVKTEAEQQAPAEVDPTPYRNLLKQRRYKDGDEESLATIPRDDIFRRGQWSVTNMVGASVANLGPRTDVPFAMVMDLLRVNCMWNPPRPNRFFAGSFEGIAELDVAPVANGPASIVIGGSLLLRYNYAAFNQRKIGVYFQFGGGGMYTDAYLKGSPVLSSGFEFIIQWGLGLRWALSKSWALNTECNFYHFSNSGIVPPNVSVNQIAVLGGLTYYFHRN